MNRISQSEKEYLDAMRPFLNPEANEQHVLNLIRLIASKAAQKGRSGYQQDVNWNDKDLK